MLESCILELKIVTRAAKQRIRVEEARAVCYLISAPERGKANKELLSLLSEKLGCAKSRLELVSGFTTTLKRVKITGYSSVAEALQRLAAEE
jgi:uncharacterized protein YggU (UPF0235/DUF167 family)